MSFDPEPVSHAATLEIKYEKGLGYFDHCGTATLALETALGEPFHSVGRPHDFSEVSSDFEQISVKFGPESFVVSQRWFETLARFQMVSRDGWPVIAKRLEVATQVTRCGHRIQLLWAIESAPVGEAMLQRAGLFRPGDAWTKVLELPEPLYTPTAVVLLPGPAARARVTLDVVNLSTRGFIPREYQRFTPGVGIMLDVDFVLYQGSTRSISVEELNKFLVSAWTQAKRMARNCGRYLADVA